MRDLFKTILFGIAFIFLPYVSAEEYRVVVIPDNIVTDNETVDSYVYNATAEFFANEVINILNQTDFIKSPSVSEERKLLKSGPEYFLPAKHLTNKFKTTYNIDYLPLKKIANKSNARYVLLLTSSIDSENYILRRTVWDFLNIPGATVTDPAYKISTYAALIDTNNSIVLWSNTFYKTISVVENRIIPRGPSPQTEQLQKIRDYSRMLCPEIAQNVQINVLPPQTLAKESKQIYYDMGNFDNVFTKKYRRWYKEGSKDYAVAKTKVDGAVANTKEKVNTAKENTKTKYNNFKEERKKRAEERALQKQLEVKAEPVTYLEKELEVNENIKENTQENVIQENVQNIKQNINQSSQIEQTKRQLPVENKIQNKIHNINFMKQKYEADEQSLYQPINIKKNKTNNLYGEFDNSRPPLRDYNY